MKYIKAKKSAVRLLHITLDNGVGGLSKVMLEISKNLDPEKFRVSVYYFKEFEETFLSELDEKGIPYYTSYQRNGKPDYFNFIKLYKFLRENQFDIIHTHNTPAFIDGILAASLAKVPIRIHTDHARLFPDKRRYMFAEKFLSFFTTKIVAVSNHTKQELIRYEKISPNKIEVIHNGINFDTTEPFDIIQKKKVLGVQNFNPVIGVGARLVEQKGISFLIQAMPKILKKYPKAVLLIAGDGPLRSKLEYEVQRLDISSSVKFLGFRLDITSLLQAFDIYVLPSLWEGLPMAILEAMALKKPIIATKVGGTPEAIIDGKTGLLVPPRSPESLTNAVIRLCENQNFAAQLGLNAFEFFMQEFTVREMVHKYEKLYYNCLGVK